MASSAYKRRLSINIAAPSGNDAASMLMREFVDSMNQKVMLKTDIAWIVEAMYERYMRERSGVSEANPISEQTVTPPSIVKTVETVRDASRTSLLPDDSAQPVKPEQTKEGQKPETAPEQDQVLAIAELQDKVAQVHRKARQKPNWGIMGS